MEIKRIEKNNIAGQAAAFYVRIQAMNVEEFGIPVQFEIDEKEPIEYIVAFDDVHPIATCRVHVIEEGYAKIERVVTLKKYRGTGVGRAIITEAENWIKEKGISKIVITSRDEAVGFYERLEYTADYDKIKNEDDAIFKCVYTEKIL